jgi:sortase A
MVPAAKSRPLTKGAVVGRVRVPSLGISAVIFEGTDESELMKGVGHWQGSPISGDGNVVLAAHRDTFFRGLKAVREGDEIVVDTPAGSSNYRVSGTSIVWPDSMEVVKPTGSPTLTLITCYPFEFFGHAPKRFIVRAYQ